MTILRDEPLQRIALAEVEGELRRVLLSPWGTVQSKNGTFTIDDVAAERILAEFGRHKTSLPIDIEHETLPEFAPREGSRGAVGWIEQIVAEKGIGLFGLVKWTDRGRELIRSDAFRYLSPVFNLSIVDRKVVGLHSAALTNKPAIPRMERLAASERAGEILKLTEGSRAMEILKKIKSKLGIEDDATVEAVLEKALERLETSERASGEFVPMSVYMATVEEVKSLQAGARKTDAKARYDRAMNAGKIPPKNEAFKTWVLEMSEDSMVFEKWFSSAPSFAPQGETKAPILGVTARAEVIRAAQAKFRADESAQRITTENAFVNGALHDSAMERLTEEDRNTFSIKV